MPSGSKCQAPHKLLLLEAWKTCLTPKKRADVITAATFRKAFAEWCYCQFELASLQLQDWRKCPPCSVDQHSCHIDGNHKVYRYDKVSRGTSPSYYNDHLIVENAKVDSHIRSLSSKITKKHMKEDSFCGDTHWKAAKAVSKAKKNQDETGLIVSGTHTESARHIRTQTLDRH
ncbi:uncharacterized protein LOC114542647 [Dendronephthya gigantea]|uniref:uncharacterized protein LOC114542647 n=1 Tax=Dendronephthya gigantea TaxID=151771 RepID=UPI0010693638|nr:uncharacterized protein LOC114542647 [Dendronephthya gigantea]